MGVPTVMHVSVVLRLMVMRELAAHPPFTRRTDSRLDTLPLVERLWSLLRCVCVCVCVFVSSCLTTKVLIGKYLPARTRRVVVSGGWGNGSGPAIAYKFVTVYITLIGVHLNMHLTDMCVCVCVCVCACVCTL